MNKFLNQLAIFATILGTIGFMLKIELTIQEKIFILFTAINATMHFSNKIDKEEK
jgi:hypothetical protein